MTPEEAKTIHISKVTVDLYSDTTAAPAHQGRPSEREHRTANKIATLLKSIKAKMNKKPKPLSETQLKDLTSIVKAAELSRDILSEGSIDNKIAGEEKQTFTNLIKTKLGPEQDEFTRKFVTPLDSIPVNFKKGDERGPKTIGEAAATNDIPIPLAYIQGKSQRQAKVAPPTATSPVDCSTQKGKKAEECEALGCGHEKDKKKCKANGGTEPQEVEEKKEEKCSKHETDKDKCEKDTGCKWDGKKRKYSSILVNKNFSLMAASFVKLVWF
uniref:Variant surface glycoprotein 1125.5653 n=1 Tax=Trypanosoma brucei TaxID=5691 RepID=A0A1J0RCN0_9TRYP|nr:variant surface glycoprotein 1125.5653 [Trypanosoma brucei]